MAQFCVLACLVHPTLLWSQSFHVRCVVHRHVYLTFYPETKAARFTPAQSHFQTSRSKHSSIRRLCSKTVVPGGGGGDDVTL
jgi:hypothetical protein